MSDLFPREEEKAPAGLFGFILGSEAGFYLIVANVAAFGFFRYTAWGNSLLDYVVLYPENFFNAKNFLCLITSGFIHANTSHLFWNILGIYVFSRIVERRLGIAGTFIVYFGSLFISMLASIFVYTYVLQQNTIIIGASGAVMGLVAASMLLDPFAITFELMVPLPVIIKGWMFLFADLKGLLNAENDGISHLVHLFGFLSIGILVYFLSEEAKKTMSIGLVINILSFIAFLFLQHWYSLP